MVVFLAAGMGLSSCQQNVPSYRLSDLQGLWQEINTEHFVRFTTEKSEEEILPPFFYGREWDEGDDVYEEDLKPYGNGWFKYQFQSTGDLKEIHLMDNGGAEIPKIYVVSKLTGTELEYYDKERKQLTFSFERITERSSE